MIHCTPVAKIR